MALTDAKVKALKPGPKRYGASDGAGLKVEVMPNGTKAWRLFTRFEGKPRMLTLGTYPDMKLAAAREAAVLAKRGARQGIDPNPEATAKAEARAATGPRDDLFRDVAERWVQKRIGEEASPITIEKYRTILQRPLLAFGETPVGAIDGRDLLALLREIEALRRFETARRTRTIMSQVFSFAIAEGNAAQDPAAGMAGALVAARAKHHAGAKEPEQVGWLLRLIRSYQGDPRTRAALLLSAYCVLRPSETRLGAWEEIDWDARLWRIPAERMKGGERPHIVPLADQALAALRYIRPLTGAGRLILSSRLNPEKPISEGTMNGALVNLGVEKSVHVPHGFRSTFSTNLNEARWNSDWVETQLHHVHGDKVRGAYNAAQYLDPRREMMQVYADWLDAMANLPEGTAGDRSGLAVPEALR